MPPHSHASQHLPLPPESLLIRELVLADWFALESMPPLPPVVHLARQRLVDRSKYGGDEINRNSISGVGHILATTHQDHVVGYDQVFSIFLR